MLGGERGGRTAWAREEEEREREDPCELRNHKDSPDCSDLYDHSTISSMKTSGWWSTGRQSLSSAPSLLLLSHVSSCHLLLLRLYFCPSCFQPASLRICSVSLRPPAINISPAGFTTHTHTHTRQSPLQEVGASNANISSFQIEKAAGLSF